MTAVNWWLQPSGVMVMTDSLLGCVQGGRSLADAVPAAFVQKAFPIAHLGVIVSGRGDGDLVAAFASRVATRVLARDYDDLSEQIPDLLHELTRHCDQRRGFSYGATTSIFVWGWSPNAGRVMGVVYRSPAGFVPEPMEDGVICAPTIDDDQTELRASFKTGNVPAAMAAAMRRQHLEAHRPSDGLTPNYVGGEVMLTILTASEGGIEISAARLFRFDDYEEDFARAVSLLDVQPLTMVGD